LHPIQPGTHRFVVANIADSDFGAQLPELVGPFINLANKRPNREPPREQLPRHLVARGPMTSTGADNQETRETGLRHLHFLLNAKAIGTPIQRRDDPQTHLLFGWADNFGAPRDRHRRPKDARPVLCPLTSGRRTRVSRI
jgi:hypothetical protein